MGKPTTREPAADRIEKAAMELFAERGFGGVGVRDIARAAKVPVSAINYYFGSKESLHRECVRKLTSEYVDEARARLDGGASAAELLEHCLDFGLRNVQLTKMWLDLQLSGDLAARDRVHREIFRPVWRTLADALEAAGEGAADRRIGLLSVMGAVVLGAVLTDDQVESIADLPADAVRERWREEILLHLAGKEGARQAIRLAD